MLDIPRFKGSCSGEEKKSLGLSRGFHKNDVGYFFKGSLREKKADRQVSETAAEGLTIG